VHVVRSLIEKCEACAESYQLSFSESRTRQTREIIAILQTGSPFRGPKLNMMFASD